MLLNFLWGVLLVHALKVRHPEIVRKFAAPNPYPWKDFKGGDQRPIYISQLAMLRYLYAREWTTLEDAKTKRICKIWVMLHSTVITLFFLLFVLGITFAIIKRSQAG